MMTFDGQNTRRNLGFFILFSVVNTACEPAPIVAESLQASTRRFADRFTGGIDASISQECISHAGDGIPFSSLSATLSAAPRYLLEVHDIWMEGEIPELPVVAEWGWFGGYFNGDVPNEGLVYAEFKRLVVDDSVSLECAGASLDEALFVEVLRNPNVSQSFTMEEIVSGVTAHQTVDTLPSFLMIADPSAVEVEQ